MTPTEPSGLFTALDAAVPDGVTTRASDRLSFAHDASHYLLVPQAVVTPRGADDVASLLRLSSTHGLALTFRSGGTSLSGQVLRHRRPPTAVVYHAVPSVLGVNRTRADAFAAAWSTWVSVADVVRTGTPEGEGILVTHRGDDPMQASTALSVVWQ